MTNIAVFASGRGTNFRAIVDHIQRGDLSCRISVFLTDNEKAAALAFARQLKIPAYILHPEQFPSEQAFGEALLEALHPFQPRWLVLAGYLKKLPANLIAHYPNRIVNIHPALLPAFGGKGMYGMRVHQAVWQAGVQVSGVTVHLVNEEYDAGPIVWQEPVVIRDCRNAEEVAQRVLKVEHRIYPFVLKRLLEQPFEVHGKRVRFREWSNDYH